MCKTCFFFFEKKKGVKYANQIDFAKNAFFRKTKKTEDGIYALENHVMDFYYMQKWKTHNFKIIEPILFGQFFSKTVHSFLVKVQTSVGLVRGVKKVTKKIKNFRKLLLALIKNIGVWTKFGSKIRKRGIFGAEKFC